MNVLEGSILMLVEGFEEYAERWWNGIMEHYGKWRNVVKGSAKFWNTLKCGAKWWNGLKSFELQIFVRTKSREHSKH